MLSVPTCLATCVVFRRGVQKDFAKLFVGHYTNLVRNSCASPWRLPLLLTILLAAGGVVYAAGGDGHNGSHIDPFASVLLVLFLIIMAAVVGRWLAAQLYQPPVLGELIIGVLVGNVGYWLGEPVFALIMHLDSAGAIFSRVWTEGIAVADAAAQLFTAEELSPGKLGARITAILTQEGAAIVVTMGFALWLFSNLGIILMLFMVGLETTVSEMLQVGFRALMVAILGVVVPFFFGFFASAYLLSHRPMSVHLFLGATLCATSVGITARVLRDLKRLQSQEAKVILGAAVIDDILGLIILAVVAGIVTTGQFHLLDVFWVFLSCAIFLSVVIFFGERLVQWTMPIVVGLDRHNSKLLFPLAMACLLAWLANSVGLATIVGAFAGGLILTEAHFAKHYTEGPRVDELMRPLETIFAPIFFVLMGMQVDLSTFADLNTLWLAFAFTVAAILGKLACGLPAGKGRDRLSIGIGMVPRGEVGLIFASIGKSLGVVTGATFAAVVIMVIVTTLLTPMALKWSLSRSRMTPRS